MAECCSIWPLFEVEEGVVAACLLVLCLTGEPKTRSVRRDRPSARKGYDRL